MNVEGQTLLLLPFISQLPFIA